MIAPIHRLLASSALLVALTASSFAQPAILHPSESGSLSERAGWAEREAAGETDEYWVGYGITRIMSPRSWIGSWSSEGNTRPSLSMVLYGEERERLPRRHDTGAGPDVVTQREEREVAILIRVAAGAPVEVEVSNIGLSVRLRELPVYWLGPAGDAESVSLLQTVFEQADDPELLEDLVMAISIHDSSADVMPFLRNVLTGGSPEDVRASAAFWTGRHGGAEALALLQRTIEQDPSAEVREQAVFAVSQIESEDATRMLIDLARTGGEHSVREKAIFWLGQKASQKATEALTDLVFDETDTELQKQAVFALSQQDEEDTLPLLLDIGKTHPNPEVRRQAIFWIGQSDDPRAVEALIALLEGP